MQLSSWTIYGACTIYEAEINGRAAPQSTARFLPNTGWGRSGAGSVARTEPGRPAHHRTGSDACAVPLARRDAAVPLLGSGVVGGPQRLARQSDRSGVLLFYGGPAC